MKKIFTLVFISLFIFACSHVKGSYRNVDGQAYDLEKMDQVQTGMTLNEVASLVGIPLEITQEGDKVLHHYHMVRERIDKDKALGVFSVEKKTTETYDVTLTYEDGIVVHKRAARSVDRPREKEDPVE